MRKLIKYLNYSLILTSILISLYYVVFRDNELILKLKDLSIILTITSPYLIEKLFKIKTTEIEKFVVIGFVFMAQFLGVTCELYNSIYWFDKFTHFLSGVLTSLIALYLLKFYKIKLNKVFVIIFIISITLAVASIWEIFEFTNSQLFDMDPQRVIKTGVNDTMYDIIVAFLGSIIVSISKLFIKD